MKQLDFNELKIFIAVAGAKSFSAAAKQLNLPKSKITRAIQRLEADLGRSIFYRTTRILSLTSFGEELVRAVDPVFSQLRAAIDGVLSDHHKTKGVIRLTAVEDIGALVITPLIARFSQVYPNVKFELDYSNSTRDLIQDGIDLAIRAGSASSVSSGSSMRMRTLGRVRFCYVASRVYLERAHGTPTPENLGAHDLILWIQDGRERQTMTFAHGKRSVKVQLVPKYVLADSRSMLDLVRLDRGIAHLPEFMCQNDLKSGVLVRLFKEWDVYSMPLTVMTPVRHPKDSLVHVFQSFLTRELEAQFPATPL
jgi:LysR family transcriptional regulator for bpeEF and oprC